MIIFSALITAIVILALVIILLIKGSDNFEK
jgi:hypothetical protein